MGQREKKMVKMAQNRMTPKRLSTMRINGCSEGHDEKLPKLNILERLSQKDYSNTFTHGSTVIEI